MAKQKLSTKRKVASLGLLGIGYAASSWGSSRLKAAWHTGDSQPIVAFELGTLAVTAGLLVRGRPVAAAFNGTAAAVLGIAWLSRRRRHA